jgi:thymidylate synthase (FAD)
MRPTEGDQIKLLDHGYVRFIEAWGGDERIIEAARMSTGKGFLGWGPMCGKCRSKNHSPATDLSDHPGVIRCNDCGAVGSDDAGDEKLLRYLRDNRHDTPFEFAGMVLEVQAPIMVFREWHRHRTQSYNEMSARYTPLPDSNYVPTPARCMLQVQGHTQNKQATKAAGAADLTHDAVLDWLEALEGVYTHAEAVYQHGLRVGIPKELARLPVPVGRYSRMRVHTCLRNWLAFMTLRSEKNLNAQWEIRQYANAVGGFLSQSFPRTWELFARGGS